MRMMFIDNVGDIFTRYSEILLKGFATDVIWVTIALTFPLGLGILLAFFASKNKILCKIFSWEGRTVNNSFKILSAFCI